MRRARHTLALLSLVLALLSLSPAIAQENSSAIETDPAKKFVAPEEEPYNRDKDEKECGEFMIYVNTTYVYPSHQIATAGEPERAIEQLRLAIAMFRKAKYFSMWCTDSLRFQITTAYKSIASIYANQGKHVLAAETLLEEVRTNSPLGRYHDYQTIYQAGHEFQVAKEYDRAVATYKLGQSQNPQKEWALIQPGLWDTYLLQGKPDLVREDLRTAESIIQSLKTPADKRAFRTEIRDTYAKLNDHDNVAKLNSILDDNHCPICGTNKTLEPIAYGLIRGPIKGFHAGGCEVSNGSPRWWCTKDKVEF